MVRWMYGVHLQSRTASTELNSQLGIERITRIKTNQTVMFSYVERKDNDDCRSFEVNGVRDRGRDRDRKTWDECVKKDLVEWGLHREWASDRVRIRGLICVCCPTRASMDNGR